MEKDVTEEEIIKRMTEVMKGCSSSHIAELAYIILGKNVTFDYETYTFTIHED